VHWGRELTEPGRVSVAVAAGRRDIAMPHRLEVSRSGGCDDAVAGWTVHTVKRKRKRIGG
jgi:hypothetical protein